MRWVADPSPGGAGCQNQSQTFRYKTLLAGPVSLPCLPRHLFAPLNVILVELVEWDTIYD